MPATKPLEDPQVEGRGRFALRMELRAEGEPIIPRALDGLNYAVGTASGDGEARCNVVDGHVVHAVDADFALAVHALHDRAHFNLQGVAMVGIHRVEVRQPPANLRQGAEELPSRRDVQQLHAATDAHHRQPPQGDHVASVCNGIPRAAP